MWYLVVMNRYNSNMTTKTYVVFFFNDTATTEIYTLSLHDALPISGEGAWTPLISESGSPRIVSVDPSQWLLCRTSTRSEEHTSELQSRLHLVCRLLLEKKKKKKSKNVINSMKVMKQVYKII